MREQAQLVLVAALVLAAVFIGIALVLNTVLFTENLATRQGDTPQTNAIEYRHASTTAVAELINQVNHNHAMSQDALRSNLTTEVTTWAHMTGSEVATRGAAATISVVAVTNGSQIQQTNSSRNFTAGGTEVGEGNWTLTDAEQTRHFRMNVSADDLYQSGTDGSLSDSQLDNVTQRAFHIVLDGTTTTQIYLFSDADGTVRVFVENASGYYGANNNNCQVDAKWATVKLVAGTINGTTCAALDAYAPKTAHEISYENATLGEEDRAAGTYELISVTSTSPPSDNYYDTDSDDSPFITPAIYAATVRVKYQTNNFNYRSRVKVVP